MSNHDKSKVIRIAMVVVDANDIEGAPLRSDGSLSPVMHPAIHNLLDGLKERDDIEVEVIYGKKNPAPGEERRDGSLRYVPLRYRNIPVPGMGGSYAGRLVAILRHLKKSRPDIVHAQGTERESGMAAALHRGPSMLTLHGNFREIARTLQAKAFSYLWVNAKLETFVLPRMNGILCISSYTRNLISPLNPNSRVVPNAVNEKMFAVVNQPIKGRVVCIASVDPRKNQLAFLEAAGDLVQKHPEFQLHFWGHASTSDAYAVSFLDAVSQHPWASFHGSADFEEIPKILSEADILVLPSLEDNCPVVILEAMAAGIPVVASRVGGIPDLVTDGKTGFTAAPENQRDLVNLVASILDSPTLREDLGHSARAEALARFTPASIAESHVDYYREILSSTES